MLFAMPCDLVDVWVHERVADRQEEREKESFQLSLYIPVQWHGPISLFILSTTVSSVRERKIDRRRDTLYTWYAYGHLSTSVYSLSVCVSSCA